MTIKITDTPMLNREMGDIIWRERMRQVEKWGTTTHTLDQYLTILTEELGECAQHMCNLNWPPDNAHYSKKNNLIALRDELSQVAAVAIAMMTGIENKLMEKI